MRSKDKFAHGNKLRGVELRIWNLAYAYTHDKSMKKELDLRMTTVEYLNGLSLQ